MSTQHLKAIVSIIMLALICVLAYQMQKVTVLWSVIVIPVIVGMLNEIEKADNEYRG